MARLLQFEPFDLDPVPPAPSGPSEDWLNGHAQGLADAADAAAQRKLAAEETALAALGDIAFTWAEARATVLASLVPFFRALTDKLIPELAAGAFPLHLVETLATTTSEDVGTIPEIGLSPAEAQAIMPILAAAGFGSVRIVPDTSLQPGEARLRQSSLTTVLDTPALVAALQDVVAAFLAVADPAVAPENQENQVPEGKLAHG
jgi:hypothetical protein